MQGAFVNQGNPNPALVRHTVYGPVRGADDSASSGTHAWKGIPFAKPPVGELRWCAPVEPDPWTEPRWATCFGPASAQYGLIHGPGLNNTYDDTIASSLGQAVGNEDCLYLNIWRPATADRDLPVILFIHGGANLTGFTADPVYDGAELARSAHAVVVTANFRLGVLGWFNLPQLKAGQDPLGDTGNYGTLDQIQVLRFIRDNIAEFGGNSGNVTVMGQSAGAMNVHALLTSPVVLEAKPQLFHRAVLMSGALALASELPPGSIPTLQPVAYSQAQGRALLNALVIADGFAADDASADAWVAAQVPDFVADYLRSKSPQELFTQVLRKLLPVGLGIASLIPEGAVVANSPLTAIKAGAYLKVPLILSTTRDEAKLFQSFLALSPLLGGLPGLIVSDATRLKLMRDFQPDAPQTLGVTDLIQPAYLPVEAPGTGYEARMALLNHIFFVVNLEAMLQALTPQQSDIWLYRFDWDEEPAPWDVVYGAAHLFDTPFVFGTFGPSVFSNAICSQANEGGRLALSQAMMNALSAFARTGDPNHEGLGLTWPIWPAKLIFDATRSEKILSVI